MRFLSEIAANTLFQIIARIASSGATFLITILVARHFGIDGFGDFAKVSAFISLFYLIVDFGLNAIFLQKGDSKVRFKELFYTRLILSLGVLIFVNAVGIFLPYNSITHIGFSPIVKLNIAIFSLTLITEAILYSSTVIFQRELSYELVMVSTVVGSIATVIFVFAATMFSYSLVFVFLSYIFGGVLESGLALFFTKEEILPFKINFKYIRQLTKESLPISLMLIFNLIYFRIDLILLSSLKPSKDVALYDLSYKFFDFLIALPLFLSNALYPSILRTEKNMGISNRKIISYSLVFVVFSIFVLIPMWIFAPLVKIIKLDFLPAIVPLRILLLSLPIFFVTSILQWVLIARRDQNFLSVVYFIATIFNILLNIVFIPQFSYIASSVITGVSEGFVMGILIFRLALWKKQIK